MPAPNVVVLGTGMAGFGAAWRLHAEGLKPILYDKNAYYGGHTMSFRYESGFLFDVGPHISFTKNERIQNLFAESVEQHYETLQVSLNNYWQGYWPLHPAQLHLYGMPADLVVKVISDFADVHYGPERPIHNYSDWLYSSFGKAFAENFPMKYTRKYHTTEAANMSIDWLGPRFYRPTLQEVLQGALSPTPKNDYVHYVTHFRYPSEGGFRLFLNKFVPLSDLRLDHELISIDPRAHELAFANGAIASYDSLVSSVPLPDLIPMIKGAPQEVLEASQRLACSTCV